MQPLLQLLHGVEHLFFPRLCAGCGSDMPDSNQPLCIRCSTSLPLTDFAQIPDNPIEKMFWGRLKLEAAASVLYFSKSGMVQQIIHGLKYKGQRETGEWMGRLMGTVLVNSGRFSAIDGLVPLPMHPAKEKKRGYNQAEVLCEGIATITGIPVVKVLKKVKLTDTQTRKHRTERWENTEGSFCLNRELLLYHQHLLLIDDVITTGATLEAAGQCLLQHGSIKLSIATLAAALK